MSDNLITPEFRVSFPNVFRPQFNKADPSQAPKYSLTMLFKKGENLDALKAAATAVVVEKFGADKTKWPKQMRVPFRNQGEKKYEGYVDGAVFMTASSRQRPGLVDAKCNDIIDEGEFYPGCYARASVGFYWYDKAGNKGVGVGLQNVQKLREGEPLNGRLKAQEEFEPVEAEGPTADAGALFNALG